ncbi:MAG TPA: XRE family transcriptional regulator [Streptosporangiaceae bacterium]|nr:XRE family transcriptional regulator [Streptosporangiaceae bacterium]
MAARAIRARGLVAGHPPARVAADIYDECAGEFGTTWVRAYRLAHGIALADVVAQVKAWYESEGRTEPKFSETLLSAYESGLKRPGPEYLHFLCAVYRADPADLGLIGNCLCGQSHRQLAGAGWPAARVTADPVPAAPASAGQPLPAGGQRPAGTPATTAGSRPVGAAPVPPAQPGWPADPAENLLEDDDDLLRRTLLRLIAHPGSPVTGTFYGAADRVRRRMDDALLTGTVSATMLDQWEETVCGYGRQYGTVPPVRLLCDVLLDFGDVRRMCERRQSLEFSERLYRLAAQLAGLAGMIMIDAGDQRLARSFFRTARAAADETGDRHLRGWVTVRQALVPLYYGDPAEAMALGQASADLAGAGSSVAGVMARTVRARALSRLAARRSDAPPGRTAYRAMSLLGQAHDMLGQLAAADRGDTALGYTERQFLFHEGDAMIMLRRHSAAEKALARALNLYSPAEVLDRSLVALGLAHCRLQANEPEEALRLSRDMLLGLPREHRAEIVVREARSLCQTVAGRHGDFPAVREYEEALRTA